MQLSSAFCAIYAPKVSFTAHFAHKIFWGNNLQFLLHERFTFTWKMFKNLLVQLHCFQRSCCCRCCACLCDTHKHFHFHFLLGGTWRCSLCRIYPIYVYVYINKCINFQWVACIRTQVHMHVLPFFFYSPFDALQRFTQLFGSSAHAV